MWKSICWGWDDDRFYKAIKKLKIEKSISKTEGTGEHTMCEALDKLINEGEERGMERGIERGTSQTLFRLVISKNLTVDVAAKDMGVSNEEFLEKMRESGYEIPKQIQ